MRLPARLALALLLSLVALACGAAPFAVRVGDVRIGLDAPPGFADTGFTGSPRLQELAESLTSASNRILLFAISDGDLRKFMVGDPPDFRRYMLVATPRGLEDQQVSLNDFNRFVGDSLRELGTVAPAGPARAYLDKQPAGKASLLAELHRDGEVVSVLQGTRLPAPQDHSDAPPQYVLSTTTLMLLRGKALNLSVFTLYQSDADAGWIRSATTRWIEELQRLNARMRSPEN